MKSVSTLENLGRMRLLILQTLQALVDRQAIKESGAKWKRPVLVTDEGSMHLMIQAIGDILRFDLKPIM